MRHCLPAAVAAALCVSLVQGAYGQDRTALRYGQIANSVHSVSSLPLYVAQRKGFFEREGIDLKVVGLGGARHQVEALDHGDVDVSHTATPYLIQAVLEGSDSVAIVGGPANTIYSMIAKPEIRSFDDLRGKLVALSLPIDTISIASRMLLEKHGLKEPAFRTKELGGTPARANCLSHGECDAAPLGQPDDIVFAQNGFTKLGDSLEVIPVLQFNVVAARRAWAQAHREAVTRFARAFGAVYKFMRERANRAEVAGILAETTGASPAVAQAMLSFYYEPDRGVMPRQGEIDMAGMREVIELLGGSGGLAPPLPPPQRFVDLQYLEAARLQ
jgi:ABC-type nitrate/sulfonate/bicarbonate transport system substrate-binding protein